MTVRSPTSHRTTARTAHPIGLSQNSMADLEARRRGRAASGHPLVYEIASLEDSCVDASVVLQDPRCVLRAFRLCRCFEERGRCPACFVHAEKASKPPGTAPVLEHSGLHGCSAPVAGATVVHTLYTGGQTKWAYGSGTNSLT